VRPIPVLVPLQHNQNKSTTTKIVAPSLTLHLVFGIVQTHELFLLGRAKEAFTSLHFSNSTRFRFKGRLTPV